MELYDRNILATRNHKYANSSSNYYVIIMVQNLYKILNSKISKKYWYSRGMKCQPKANNNREAVVLCARHVVKRPSKRMRASLYYSIKTQLKYVCVYICLYVQN